MLDDVEDLFAEGTHQFAGKVRTDAFDHTRSEIFLDTLSGARWHDVQADRFELQAVRAIGDPPALAFDVLTGSDVRRRTDHRDEVALAPHLDSQHAEAGLLAVEGDALDRPAEVLERMVGRRKESL